MTDWKKLVEERLSASNLPSEVKDEVIAELAAHLEDSEGASDPTLDAVPWQKLKRAIEQAKHQEEPMSRRTRNLWLGGMAILFAVGLVLLFLDRAASMQRLIWWACAMMLLCAAQSEASRLNQRTKSIWLPGFVSLTAANLFLFGAEVALSHDTSFYYANIGTHPYRISGLPIWFYFGWLLTQILCGAVGAYLSRRAGGSWRARVLAAEFPAIVMFALCMLVIPLSALIGHNVIHPLYFLLGVFIWVVPPAIALVAGATPFLLEAQLVEA